MYIWIYILLLIAISFFVSRKEKNEDFLISGRDRSWFTIMASKFAGSVGISWFIAYTGYAYKFWVWMYVLLIGFLLGYILFAFWVVPRVYDISKKHKFYTQGDLVHYHTKSHLWKKITNYYSSIIQFTWLLASFIWGAKVMSSIWWLSYELALLFTVVTVTSYILLAWYKAVLITDIFQSIIMIVLFFVLTQDIVWWENILWLIDQDTLKLDIASIIWLFLYGTLSILALSDRYQLMYAAKTQRDIQKGMFLTFIPVTIVGIFAMIIGLKIFAENPWLDPDLVFIESIIWLASSNLIPLAFVMLFAGLMSSADTYIYAISSHIVLERGNTNQKENIIDIRIMTIVVVLIAGSISFVFRDIIGITIIGAALSLIMSFPMIYIIRWWKSSIRFLWSLIWGLLGLIFGIMFIGLEPSLALIVLLGGGLGLFKN